MKQVKQKLRTKGGRSKPVLDSSFKQSEVVIAFVGAVGVDLEKVESLFQERLRATGYKVHLIGITKDVFPMIDPKHGKEWEKGKFARIQRMMNVGNQIRKKSKNNGILALGAAAKIAERRSSSGGQPKTAYLIRSLKRPEEVRRLREIYPRGFYLVGVHAEREKRKQHLTIHREMSAQEAQQLMDRDMNESGNDYGQQIVNTFHLSDFFVRLEANDDRLKGSIWRIVDLMFSDPHSTPAFSEHAMFLAFAASLRSGDLSRQVGAVIARDGEILSTGANDCPKAGGGLYWPEMCKNTQTIKDLPNGRDSIRGKDSNKAEQLEIIDSILKCFKGIKGVPITKMRNVLKESAISDLTEFGRVVHAEMEALLSCARKGISTRGATMYCTTFPCHNCAKHIIAAGIDRVVFIEPYLKSKAIKLHDDAITIDYGDDVASTNPSANVRFQPFVGVGPRRFFELFSMNLGVGIPIKRKDESGRAAKWLPTGATLRIQMLPKSYLELEAEASDMFHKLVNDLSR